MNKQNYPHYEENPSRRYYYQDNHQTQYSDRHEGNLPYESCRHNYPHYEENPSRRYDYQDNYRYHQTQRIYHHHEDNHLPHPYHEKYLEYRQYRPSYHQYRPQCRPYDGDPEGHRYENETSQFGKRIKFFYRY